MSKVSVSHVMAASPATLWGLVGDPASLSSWHPAIAQSPVSDGGRVRTCRLADGGEVREEILAHDPAGRSYTYRIVSSPLPMTDYVSTLSVTDAEGGARITWQCECQPAGIAEAELEAMLRGLYEAGLSALRARAETA